MKSDALLDSLVFQLTPTRTRCELIVIANGRTEKLASGLVNPFLAHLKAAQDQIALGGYSILLIPDCGKVALWFTKGTVERFVRFVSTPEILERVITIEAEMLQIEEAISIQNNENQGLNLVESHTKECSNYIEGPKSPIRAETENAIVLCKLEPHSSEPNVSADQRKMGNSRIQLLRVLETRKTVLKKEQGMAFARSVAAGFDLDHLKNLILFAECFGATRLKDACIRFSELWKEKHVTSQLAEIEATEDTTVHGVSSASVSGVMISDDQQSQNGCLLERKCKVGADDGFASYNVSHDGGLEFGVPNMLNEGDSMQRNNYAYRYAQWAVLPSPAGLMFQQYYLQGVPGYTNYPGLDSIYHAQNVLMEDHGHNTTRKMKRKMTAFRTKDGSFNSEDAAVESLSGSGSDYIKNDESKLVRSERNEDNRGASQSKSSAKSKRHHTVGSEEESESESESGQDNKSSVMSKSKTKLSRSCGIQNLNHGGDNLIEPELDNGNWKAFQDCLLREDQERTSPLGKDIYSSEKEIYYKRKQHAAIADPILDCEIDLREVPEHSVNIMESATGRSVPLYGKRSSMDEPTNVGRESHAPNKVIDFQLMESDVKECMEAPADDFVIYRQEKEGSGIFFTDSLTQINFDHKIANDMHTLGDESFVVPHRSNLPGFVSMDRENIDVLEPELPESIEKKKELLVKTIPRQLKYEPDDLSMMPKREIESAFSVHDSAFDSKMEVHIKNNALRKSEAGGANSVTRVLKKVDKEKKHSVGMGKGETMAIKGKHSKLSSTIDAQLRAERMRAYKADLQKIRKEKEEEEMKRLETLKRERKRRIAGRTNLTTASPSSESKPRLPMMFHTGSVKASKFCDSEPTYESPLSKLPLRTQSLGSSEIIKSIGRQNNAARTASHGLTRSVSSLPELKKEVSLGFNESEKSPGWTRRLSDPKGSTIGLVRPKKMITNNLNVKPKVTNDTEAKKMSAIVNLDRTKAASLPGLKIKARQSCTDDSFDAKEAMQTGSNEDFGAFECTKLKIDDHTFVEKAVVLLGDETTRIQETELSFKASSLLKENNLMVKSKDIPDNVTTQLPDTPAVTEQVTRWHSEFMLAVLPCIHEGNANHEEGQEPCGRSGVVNETPYQAPFARLSSLERPSSSNPEHDKTPLISSESNLPETPKANNSPMTGKPFQQKDSGFSEKPKNKDSPKGFQWLLNCARKSPSSTSSEQNDVNKKSGANETVGDANSSPEVPTLKNLIFLDESPVINKPRKVSRAFSLLSPFRSKTSQTKSVS